MKRLVYSSPVKNVSALMYKVDLSYPKQAIKVSKADVTI